MAFGSGPGEKIAIRTRTRGESVAQQWQKEVILQRNAMGHFFTGVNNLHADLILKTSTFQLRVQNMPSTSLQVYMGPSTFLVHPM